MISFLLGLVIGLVGGWIGGIYYVGRYLRKNIITTDLPRDLINDIIIQQPKGEFIHVNSVEEYIKNHDGEIKLGDVLDDDRS